MAMEEACMATCCLGALALLAVGLLFSWTTIAPTEMALKKNYILKTVSPDVMAVPGLQFIGPFASLVRYPKTIQTLEFSAGTRDLLDGRTKDGLPITLGVTFQYRLLPGSLYQLYRNFENTPGDFAHIYRLMGIHTITELATNFTAYQFFNEKQKIAEFMRQGLDRYYQEHLCATVESLQLNEDDLPNAFTDAINQAANSKANITQMQKRRDAKAVEFATARIVAEAQANVTIQQAEGERNKILQNGRADTSIIEAYVEAETQAYSKIHTEMKLQGDNLLKYIWYDTLAGGSVAASTTGDAGQTSGESIEMLYGLNPSSYISER